MSIRNHYRPSMLEMRTSSYLWLLIGKADSPDAVSSPHPITCTPGVSLELADHKRVKSQQHFVCVIAWYIKAKEQSQPG